MLRTANMHSVPTPASRVRFRTTGRAFWFSMWKASITTSKGGSSPSARSSICVRRIARAGLGYGEVAQLALLLLAQQGRHELGDRVVVLRRRQPVQVEEINVVGAEPAQRGVEARHHGLGRLGCAGRCDLGLGRDDHVIARAALDGLADDLLGAVRLGRVDEVDAEVERLPHKGDGLRGGEAGALADAAVAAAAEPGDADFQAGAAEGCVLHCAQESALLVG